MNIKRCIPLLVFVILLAAAAVQGLRRQAAQPELLQSQVTAAENSLETVESLELEIELRAPEELEMSYSSGGRAFSTRGADPEEAVRLFVEALPHLEEGRPLAIIQAALHGVSTAGATLYCTHQPCILCVKMLINAGVKRVVFQGDYPDALALELLNEAGLEIVRRSGGEGKE